tara:strand:- start:2232 stop:3983 length:1752 start_codon:yes stop_codon:yes gene_type:complete
MCGFFGYISNKPLNASLKKKFLNVDTFLSQRGPDISNFITGNNFFYKHWRLKIQDLKNRSNQPFTNSKANLLYNGEIYNFKNLKKSKKINTKYNTSGDTEVLFKYLNEFGIEKTIKNIEGMFSFMYQEKKTNKVFLVRDRFGQKPLYYYKDDSKFIFSSEIKPIIYFIKNIIKIDKDLLKEYLYHNVYFGSKNTFFKKIKQVLPGNYLIFENFNINEKSYYNFKNLSKNKKKFKIKEFSKNIKQTVDKHLIADKDICLSLSSGVDSKSLVALISQSKFRKNLKKSYSFSFQNFKSEDLEANKFSSILGIRNQKILITKKDIINNFKKLIQINEGPIGGIANIAMLLLCKKVKLDGYNVLLAGYGMDEALYGYNSLNFFKYPNKDNLKMPDVKNFNSLHSKFLGDYKSFEADKKKYQMLFNDKIPRTVHMCDRFSMINSVELRLPYLDHKFIESVSNYYYEDYFFKKSFISKKPLRIFLNSLKIKNMQNWIFKKNHNPTPQNIWLKEQPIKSWAFKHINSNKIYKNLDFLDKKKVLIAWNDFQKDKKNKINGYFFWQLLNIYYLIDLDIFSFNQIKKNKFFNEK